MWGFVVCGERLGSGEGMGEECWDDMASQGMITSWRMVIGPPENGWSTMSEGLNEWRTQSIRLRQWIEFPFMGPVRIRSRRKRYYLHEIAVETRVLGKVRVLCSKHVL